MSDFLRALFMMSRQSLPGSMSLGEKKTFRFRKPNTVRTHSWNPSAAVLLTLPDQLMNRFIASPLV
jgi:hypothetical protein